MTALSKQAGRKLAIGERTMKLGRLFMQLKAAFDAMAQATDEEMQARPTRTEVAQMIGQAIEQALGQRVVHAVTVDDMLALAQSAAGKAERTLTLVDTNTDAVRSEPAESAISNPAGPSLVVTDA